MAYYPANNRDLTVPDEIRPMLESRVRKIAEANIEVEKLAERLGLRFINVNDGLADETGLQKKEFSIDGVHMYANGYKIVYQNLKPYLEKYSL